MKALALFIMFFSLSVFANPGEKTQWEKIDNPQITYFQYRPEVPTGKKRGLMVALHGCAQKSQDLAIYGNWEKAAETFSTDIIVPQVPGGGVYMGCWDYYGANHSSKSRHSRYIIDLVESLLRNPENQIDPRRIYVSGLSSGAAQALVLGCLRPDLFSGVGVNSSPAVPTTAYGLSKPQITVNDMVAFCSQVAGTRHTGLSRQKVSVLMGDNDYLVSPEHGKLIYQAMKVLTGSEQEENLDLTTLPGNHLQGQGVVALNSQGEPQVSVIINQGLGHNWAAGDGATGGSFVAHNSIAYPFYLLQFFSNQKPSH